jgi:hypothetical protein
LGGRRWWRDWDFVDRLGVAVTIVTALLLIGLVLATTLNSDSPYP